MYVCTCMYVCCLPAFTIAHSTLILEVLTVLEMVIHVSLLTHLKHRVSISVFQSNSESSNSISVLPVPLEVLDMVLHRNFS